MEDRVFELLEKLYSEFTDFKQDISKKVDNLDKKVDSLDKKVDSLDKKVDYLDKKVDTVDKKADKNSLLLERMDDKIKILAEVQQNHYEMNQRQHEEMIENNREQLELMKSALHNISQRI